MSALGTRSQVQPLSLSLPFLSFSSLDAFEGKQIADHPGARERIIQMQFVDPVHNDKIGRRHIRRCRG
jgi:hypothetical protein